MEKPWTPRSPLWVDTHPHIAITHPETGELLDTAATTALLRGDPDAEVTLADYRMRLEMLLAQRDWLRRGSR